MQIKKRVLVIDDDPKVLHFVTLALSVAGYDVTTTHDGEKGLELADSFKPDIVLLDMVMYPLSGFDVLTRLRERSDIPILMFTARADIEAFATREGASGFISKPFRAEQLVRKIQEILEIQVQKPRLST